MFCVLVVAARPKTRMSTDTMSSSAVTTMDFLFLLLKEPAGRKVIIIIIIISWWWSIILQLHEASVWNPPASRTNRVIFLLGAFRLQTAAVRHAVIQRFCHICVGAWLWRQLKQELILTQRNDVDIKSAIYHWAKSEKSASGLRETAPLKWIADLGGRPLLPFSLPPLFCSNKGQHGFFTSILFVSVFVQ